METKGVEDDNMETTGVDDINDDGIINDDINEDINEEVNGNMSNYNDPNTDNNDNFNAIDDDISIKGELSDDTYVTINDINIVREMNSAQLNNGPETEEERDREAINNSHRYNLRPRATTRNQKYTFTQVNNQLNIQKHTHT